MIEPKSEFVDSCKLGVVWGHIIKQLCEQGLLGQCCIPADEDASGNGVAQESSSVFVEQ